jgi:hypothetical protein
MFNKLSLPLRLSDYNFGMFLGSPVHAACPTHLILILITLTTLGYEYKF